MLVVAAVLGERAGDAQERGERVVDTADRVEVVGHGVAGGDLLTTSKTQGHAMRASDPRRAFGSIVGKAMSGLAEGLGMIPVLVALQ